MLCPWVSVGCSRPSVYMTRFLAWVSASTWKAALPFADDLDSEVGSIISAQACLSKGRNIRLPLDILKKTVGWKVLQLFSVHHLATVIHIPPTCIINSGPLIPIHQNLGAHDLIRSWYGWGIWVNKAWVPLLVWIPVNWGVNLPCSTQIPSRHNMTCPDIPIQTVKWKAHASHLAIAILK